MNNPLNTLAAEVIGFLPRCFCRLELPISTPPRLGTYLGLVGANIDASLLPVLGKVASQKRFGYGQQPVLDEVARRDCERYAMTLMAKAPANHRLFVAQIAPSGRQQLDAMLFDALSWMVERRVSITFIHKEILEAMWFGKQNDKPTYSILHHEKRLRNHGPEQDQGPTYHLQWQS